MEHIDPDLDTAAKDVCWIGVKAIRASSLEVIALRQIGNDPDFPQQFVSFLKELHAKLMANAGLPRSFQINIGTHTTLTDIHEALKNSGHRIAPDALDLMVQVELGRAAGPIRAACATMKDLGIEVHGRVTDWFKELDARDARQLPQEAALLFLVNTHDLPPVYRVVFITRPLKTPDGQLFYFCHWHEQGASWLGVVSAHPGAIWDANTLVVYGL